ncbi:MAG: YybH family protein [Leptolyngbyaceae cyanobacterium]
MNNLSAAERVREAIREWLSACQTRDFEKLATLYDSEAVYAHDRAALICGVPNIVAWFENALSQLPFESYFKEEVLLVEGNIAIAVGKFCLVPTDKQFPPEAGRAVFTYRRSADDRWLLVCDIDNRPPDCSPKDFDIIAKEVSDN